jgi:hypothetical protein
MWPRHAAIRSEADYASPHPHRVIPGDVIQPAAGIHVACPVMKERSLAP